MITLLSQLLPLTSKRWKRARAHTQSSTDTPFADVIKVSMD